MTHTPAFRTILTLTCALFLTAMIPPASAGHSVEITSGAASAGTYTMEVKIDSFKLVPVGSADSNTKGEGHIHYLVNGKPAEGDYATTSKSFTFTGLQNGDELTVELVNNDHTSTDPQAKATMTVGANEAPAGNMAILALGTVGVIALAAIVGRRKD